MDGSGVLGKESVDTGLVPFVVFHSSTPKCVCVVDTSIRLGESLIKRSVYRIVT